MARASVRQSVSLAALRRRRSAAAPHLLSSAESIMAAARSARHVSGAFGRPRTRAAARTVGGGKLLLHENVLRALASDARRKQRTARGQQQRPYIVALGAQREVICRKARVSSGRAVRAASALPAPNTMSKSSRARSRVVMASRLRERERGGQAHFEFSRTFGGAESRARRRRSGGARARTWPSASPPAG